MVEQKLKLKLFGIARDIIGSGEVEVTAVANVAQLRRKLFNDYPKLKDLNSLMIAVNHAYATDEIPLSNTDEIAIIPPVSGG